MLYQSLKFTNGIWVLAELKMQPGNPVVQVSHLSPCFADSQAVKVAGNSFQSHLKFSKI